MPVLPKASSLFAFLAALGLCAGGAHAHVSLQDGQAEAGVRYQAVLRVGHGCDGAATTALTVRIPAGFAQIEPVARPGWTLSSRRGEVTWTAAGEQAALPGDQRAEFTIGGSLPQRTGPLWFKVRQTCGKAALDWSQVPAQGTDTAGLKTPAALLQVLSARDLAQQRALPRVEGGWVRSMVAGQQSAAGYMTLTASEPMQLIGIATPVADTAEVHQMKMEGDVMRMRAVPQLDLPAGQAVELKPGGYHIMLMELKQPLTSGMAIPMTLLLRNAKGVESRLQLKLPVAAQAPGSSPAAPAPAHKH